MGIESLTTAITSGDRRALARAITLVESARSDHRAQATELLAQLAATASMPKPVRTTVPEPSAHDNGSPLPEAIPHRTPAAATPEPHSDHSPQAHPTSASASAPAAPYQPSHTLRLGLTGAPGVGKSSFIEALGLHLTGLGKTVAVLAIDPSSQRGGGAVLGDKTRMERLSRAPGVFVRPSPSGGQAGGVARRSREVITLCEAAGFDVILLETVGVGQSETMAADMVDVFALLIAPAGGDELQGVKRGVMERADLILVNKADGDLRAQARATRADYAAALRLLRPRPEDPPRFPRALTVSAREGTGIAPAWEAIAMLARWRDEHGITASIRADQARAAFREEVTAALLARLTDDAALASRMVTLEAEVAAGRLSPAAAAAQAIAPLTQSRPE